jgi:hypothetical protein
MLLKKLYGISGFPVGFDKKGELFLCEVDRGQ